MAAEGFFKEGQRVWHKGRPATFLYYMGAAAAIRFDGRRDSTVVRASAVSLTKKTYVPRAEA